jgi:hypothetical protein
MSSDTYYRSRFEILSWIMQFFTKNYYGSDDVSRVSATQGFHSEFMTGQDPPIESLCILIGAPATKWYLGWLVKIEPGYGGDKQYTIRSIEDGSLCRWFNVDIKWLLPEVTDRFPSWKWTDKQFKVSDRWRRIARLNNDYTTVPLNPIFHDDGSVTLGTREKFGGLLEDGGYRPTKVFPSWKKLKTAEMKSFYLHAIQSRDEQYKRKNHEKV